MTPEEIERIAYEWDSTIAGMHMDSLFAFAAAIEAATIERIAAWIEPQRNDVPATGKEFAAAIRAIAKKEGV